MNFASLGSLTSVILRSYLMGFERGAVTSESKFARETECRMLTTVASFCSHELHHLINIS